MVARRPMESWRTDKRRALVGDAEELPTPIPVCLSIVLGGMIWDADLRELHGRLASQL